jgi:hypothetical protein
MTTLLHLDRLIFRSRRLTIRRFARARLPILRNRGEKRTLTDSTSGITQALEIDQKRPNFGIRVARAHEQVEGLRSNEIAGAELIEGNVDGVGNAKGRGITGFVENFKGEKVGGRMAGRDFNDLVPNGISSPLDNPGLLTMPPPTTETNPDIRIRLDAVGNDEAEGFGEGHAENQSGLH